MLDQTFTNIDSISEELLVHIFSYLKPNDLLNAMLVRKLWQGIAKEPLIWRNLITQHFPYLIKNKEKYQTDPQALFTSELEQINNNLKRNPDYGSIKPLILASLRGDVVKINQLPISVAAKHLLSILAFANGHKVAAKELNISEKKKAFILAAQNGYRPAIEMMLSELGDDLTPESKGLALKTAAKFGHLDVVEALLANAADVISLKDKREAMDNAAYGKHLDVLQAIFAHFGLDVSAAFKGLSSKNATDDEIIKSMFIHFNEMLPSKEKGEILKRAALAGQLSLVEVILTHAGQAISSNDKGLALRSATSFGHFEVIQALLTQTGETIDSLDKGLALQDAANRGSLSIVRALLTGPGNPISAQDKGVALSCAAANGRVDVIQSLFILAGEEISAQDKGRVLRSAVEYVRLDVVQALVGPKITPLEKALIIDKAIQEVDIKVIQAFFQSRQEISVEDIAYAISEATGDKYIKSGIFYPAELERILPDIRLKQQEIKSLILERYGRELPFITLILAIGLIQTFRFYASKATTTLIEKCNRVINYFSSIVVIGLSWITSFVNKPSEPMTSEQPQLPPTTYQQWNEQFESDPLPTVKMKLDIILRSEEEKADEKKKTPKLS